MARGGGGEAGDAHRRACPCLHKRGGGASSRLILNHLNLNLNLNLLFLLLLVVAQGGHAWACVRRGGGALGAQCRPTGREGDGANAGPPVVLRLQISEESWRKV